MNAKIISENDPHAIESMIENYDRKYEALLLVQKKQNEENVAKKKAVADEIRQAVQKAQEYQRYKKKRLEELVQYVEKKKEESLAWKLLES